MHYKTELKLCTSESTACCGIPRRNASEPAGAVRFLRGFSKAKAEHNHTKRLPWTTKTRVTCKHAT